MSQVPARMDLGDIQQAFREIWEAIQPLIATGAFNLSGRVATNAGDARLPTDLATLKQAISEAEKAVKNVSQAGGPATGTVGYDTVQVNGTGLAQRHILNIAGGSVTGADVVSGTSKVTINTAGASQEGTVTTGSQTIAGAKTFTSNLTVQKTAALITIDANSVSGQSELLLSAQDGAGVDATVGEIYAQNNAGLFVKSDVGTLTLTCQTKSATFNSAGSLSVPTQLISTVATGTAPLAVTSTTAVSNLNASLLLGNTWAAPGAIGLTTPASSQFTAVTINDPATPDLLLQFGGNNGAEFFHDGTNATLRADAGHMQLNAITAGKLVKSLVAFTVKGATPTSAAGEIGLGNTSGVGNGAAGNVQAPAIGTGSGPAAANTIVLWLEVDLAGTKYWIPLAQ